MLQPDPLTRKCLYHQSPTLVAFRQSPPLGWVSDHLGKCLERFVELIHDTARTANEGIFRFLPQEGGFHAIYG